MGKITAAITGVGQYLPEYILTNDELSRMVDTNDEWIMSHTGIKTRHILKGEGIGSSYMGARAVINLLDKTGVDPMEIDVVICATVTPDMFFPSTGNLIADQAGCKNAFAFDVSAACSGFLFALTTGAKFIEAGTSKKVIVVGADKMSSIVDYTDRSTCPLFGDAAAAAQRRVAELQQEIAEAERRLESVRFQVDKELETERRRLAVGQEQLRAFIRDVRAVCNEELAALDLLPELPPEPAAPPPLAVAAMAAMTAAEPAEEPAEEAAPPETEEDEVKRNLQDVLSAIAAEPAAEAGEPVGDPFAEEGTGAGDLEDTRVLNLDDLQFGRNYTKD